jgi:acetolactate synthase I/II/III large subunit
MWHLPLHSRAMKTIDAIAQVLKAEGIQHLPCFPTTPVIEACAAAGIRPIICRQERVGVGIADGFSRVTEGRVPGVFAMQYGPGAENAYAGVATAFSDSSPVLLLPLGHPEDRQGIYPLFDSVRSFHSVTKRVDRLTSPGRTTDVLRRAFTALRTGRPGPVMVEIPAEVATQDAPEPAYASVPRSVSGADPRDVERAARALCAAERPVVLAGQGVLYAEATDELVELSELLGLPVATTLLGKSAFPETHALSLGCGTHVMPSAVGAFFSRADLVFAIGTSLTKHFTVMSLPKGFGRGGPGGGSEPGKTLIHATNDPVDLHKDYVSDHPLVGDAKVLLRQLIEAVREIVGPAGRPRPGVALEIATLHAEWLEAWRPKLTSAERPIDPYRVVWELTQAVRAQDAIVTHDSGNPRGQLVPFYRTAGPRGFLGWGKSHGLGTGLGLVMGAKIAQPDKVCINVMGDAAFGMVGLDFEAAVRCQIPIITVVLNNAGMASERRAMPQAEAAFQTSDLIGNYADIARALGGHAERIEDPGDVPDAFARAVRHTREQGQPVLLEFITARETESSNPGRNFVPREVPTA